MTVVLNADGSTVMRNPRRERMNHLVLPSYNEVEMGYYSCINDCRLAVCIASSGSSASKGGIVAGVVFEVIHGSLDCSRPSQLVPAGCFLYVTRASPLYSRILEVSAESIEYAVRGDKGVVAVLECDLAFKLISRERAGLVCRSYSCIDDYGELYDVVVSLVS